MTDRHIDSQGVPIGGYDTPLTAPDGYADFTHTPTPAERADCTARMNYNSAMLAALQDMPPDIEALSNASVSLLLYGDPAEGKRLGRKVQAWRAIARVEAKKYKEMSYDDDLQ